MVSSRVCVVPALPAFDVSSPISLSQHSSKTRSASVWLIALIPAIAVLYAFVPYTFSHLPDGAQLVSVFHALWIMWKIFPDFQHGMLVPFLVGVIVYLRRRQLATLPIQGWWPGIVFVGLSLAVYWVGRRIDNQYIGFFSLQLITGSLVLWLLGWRWFATLAFPIAFFIFAWPLPFLDNLVAFPLRMIMSTASVAVLQIFGVNAVKDGTAIISGANSALGLGPGATFAVDVADPCSGIHSLFALMMISALYGNLTLKKPWQRGVLFLASMPLAVIGNLVRIILLTFGTIVLGPKVAIGTLEDPTVFHMVSGYAVFLVALAGMVVVAFLLSHRPRDLFQEIRAFVRSKSVSQKTSSPAPVTSSDLY